MAVQRSRFYTILSVVAGIAVLAALIHLMDYKSAFEIPRIIPKFRSSDDQSVEHKSFSTVGDYVDSNIGVGQAHQKSWYEIAMAAGTDKVTTHEYQYMYEKYLPAIRNGHVKMLEIGLGCNMNYGPGKSYATWLEYFPNLDLYYIEYDGACAAKWAHKTQNAHVFAGDQSNVTFLEEFLDNAGMDFDVIIDDGGHTMTQQITSLEHLWRAVKPGGYYFLEDLQTSYMAGHYGGDPSTKDPNIKTAMKFIYELIDDRMTGRSGHDISSNMRSIDCMKEVCAFTKKSAAVF
ncbi:hypothetical protein jhhlp_001706 [Lomentospora prolificans]|uniref:Methyltransferase domain-containing protein n=1 Tax=Lomentospora prolificans TaxID=41688 RepID=A0A2N3NH13_9PEZI|nr:hypothetical protein jhhlp_001706 [Lomentospora prolificans]